MIDRSKTDRTNGLRPVMLRRPGEQARHLRRAWLCRAWFGQVANIDCFAVEVEMTIGMGGRRSVKFVLTKRDVKGSKGS